MTKMLIAALSGAIVLGSTSAALAVSGEFGNHDAMAMVSGKMMETTCQVSEPLGGKVYCFIDEASKTEFMKDATANIRKAAYHYSKVR